jgi:hypothetical protein
LGFRAALIYCASTNPTCARCVIWYQSQVGLAEAQQMIHLAQVGLAEDANIVVNMTSLGASNPILEFCYNCIFFMILDCALG